MNIADKVKGSILDGSWKMSQGFEVFVGSRGFFRSEYDGRPDTKPDSFELTYNFYLDTVATGYAQINIFQPNVELTAYFPFRWIFELAPKKTRYGSVCLAVALEDIKKRATINGWKLLTMDDKDPQVDRQYQREKIGLHPNKSYSFQEQVDKLQIYLQSRQLDETAKLFTAQVKDAAQFGKKLPDPVAAHLALTFA